MKTKKIILIVCLCLLPVIFVVNTILLIHFYPFQEDLGAYPKTTLTKQGKQYDPVNIVVLGTREQVTQAFLKAGWMIPDPITPKTSERIAVDALLHKSYPTAPVSSEYLFHRAQDLAFEQEVGDVTKRHHIRLWQVQGTDTWLGGAVFDDGIEIGASHTPTHHISGAVDKERAYTAASLMKSATAEAAVQFTEPSFASFNAGGDYYVTDGEAAIVSFSQLPQGIHPERLHQGVYAYKDFILQIYTWLLSLSGI